MIFQSSVLSWKEIFVTTIYGLGYIGLISMVMLEKTKPISLMSDKQLSQNEVEYGQIPVIEEQGYDSLNEEAKLE